MAELAIILWFALLATVFLGLRWAPFGTDGQQNLVSAHGLVMIMFFTFLILPASTPVFLTNGDLTWAPAFSGSDNVVEGLLLVWVSLGIFLVSYRIFRPSTRAALPVTNSLPTTDGAATVIVLLGMVGLGLVLKGLAVQLGGGLDATILRMSGGVAENMGLSREGSGLLQQMRSFSIIADLSASWLFALALAQRRWRLAAFVLLVAVMTVTMAITGKRLFIFWPMMAFAISLSIFVFKIRPRHFLVVTAATFLLGWLSLSYRIYAPLSTAGMLDSFDLRAVPWAQGSMWRFYFNSLEFAYFDLTVAALKGSDAVTRLFGGQMEMVYKTQIEPILYIVPRALWPGKPELFLDLAHGLASLVFFEDVNTIDLGVASTLTGTAWLSGGMLGVVMAFGFFGFFAAKCDQFFYSTAGYGQTAPLRILIYAFMLMAVFHLFRQGTFGWVFIIVIVQQLGGILALFMLWFATQRGTGLSSRPRAKVVIH